LRRANKESEQALWKVKKKAEQEVEVAVAEFDRELADRHSEVCVEQDAYDELCSSTLVSLTWNVLVLGTPPQDGTFSD
jgi:hypothetical protein